MALEVGPVIAAVGRRVAFYRYRRGWTQDKLAFTIGMSRPTIANLERGRHQLSLQMFLDIATALGVDPCALLSDSEPSSRDSEFSRCADDSSPVASNGQR